MGKHSSLNRTTTTSTPRRGGGREEKKKDLQLRWASVSAKGVGLGQCRPMGEVRQHDEPHQSWIAETTQNYVVCSVGFFGQISSMLRFVVLQKQMAGNSRFKSLEPQINTEAEKDKPRIWPFPNLKARITSRLTPRPRCYNITFFSSYHHYSCKRQSYGSILMNNLQQESQRFANLFNLNSVHFNSTY